MSALGMNITSSVSSGTQASASSGDKVWLRAMRHSPVSQTPIYRATQLRVRNAMLAEHGFQMSAR